MGYAAESQEYEVIDIGHVRAVLSRQVLDELQAAYTRKEDVSESYADACDHAARKVGIKPSVLKAYVKARATDKLEEAREQARQLSMLFDEL